MKAKYWLPISILLILVGNKTMKGHGGPVDWYHIPYEIKEYQENKKYDIFIKNNCPDDLRVKIEWLSEEKELIKETEWVEIDKGDKDWISNITNDFYGGTAYILVESPNKENNIYYDKIHYEDNKWGIYTTVSDQLIILCD